MFDTSRIFSDARANESMLRAAVLIGLEHELSSDGRLNYCDDANRLGDPGERVLDEIFNSEWIALGIDSELDQQTVVDQLTSLGISFIVEWCNDITYVILNRFDCPKNLEGRQI